MEYKIIKTGADKFFAANPEATECFVSLGKGFADKKFAEHFLRGVNGEKVHHFIKESNEVKEDKEAETKEAPATETVINPEEEKAGVPEANEEVSAPASDEVTTTNTAGEETVPTEAVAPVNDKESKKGKTTRPVKAMK